MSFNLSDNITTLNRASLNEYATPAMILVVLNGEKLALLFIKLNAPFLNSLESHLSGLHLVILDMPKQSIVEYELAFLLQCARDAFNRWDAGQRLVMRTLQTLINACQAGQSLGIEHEFTSAWQASLNDETLDAALQAEALNLPSETDIAEVNRPIDPKAIHEVRQFVYQALAKALRIDLEKYYHTLNIQADYQIDSQSMGQRKLKNICLKYLSYTNDQSSVNLIKHQYDQATNMTDALAAMSILSHIECTERRQMLQHFYKKLQHHTLVIDKWFAIQASSSLPHTLDVIKNELMQDKLFDIKTSNKIRAVIGSFSMRNPVNFHAEDGRG